MKEQFSGEKDPAPENLEPQKKEELRDAMTEQLAAMAEFNKALSTPARPKAKKIVLEKLALSMKKAMKKSSEALDAWRDTMHEPGEPKKEN